MLVNRVTFTEALSQLEPDRTLPVAQRHADYSKEQAVLQVRVAAETLVVWLRAAAQVGLRWG